MASVAFQMARMDSLEYLDSQGSLACLAVAEEYLDSLGSQALLDSLVVGWQDSLVEDCLVQLEYLVLVG